MSYRSFRSFVLCVLVAAIPTISSGAIYQWTTDANGNRVGSGTLCPDGAGVSALPNENLSNLDLTKADLHDVDLTNVNFNSSKLTDASFLYADLTFTNFTDSNITGAWFYHSNLTPDQLSSTASYKSHDLSGMLLYVDFSGFNFEGQNLCHASFGDADFSNANFNNANLTNAAFNNANLSNAVLTNANLTNAIIAQTTDLTNADMTEAKLNGAVFIESNLTPKQLCSTASYKSYDLSGISLTNCDLRGCILNGQNLTNTFFWSVNMSSTTLHDANLADAFLDYVNLSNSTLTNANLGNSWIGNTDLTGTDMTGCNITGAWFSSINITSRQLYSTANYKAHDLSGIGFSYIDMTGFNFAGQNLSSAIFIHTNLTNATLSNANLTMTNFAYTNLSGVDLRGVIGFAETDANANNIIMPNGVIRGLRLDNNNPLLIIRNFVCLEEQSPITIHITQNMQLESGGTLDVVLDDKPWNSTISFDKDIPITIAGNLMLEIESADPSVLIGTSFRLFDWTGVKRNGEFQIVCDAVWDTSDLYADGTVILLAVPEPYTLILLGSVAAFLGLAIIRRQTLRL